MVGLLASYVYLQTALFSAVFFAYEGSVPNLPVPFFPPQAIILSVLLLTPARRWWLYLLAYYAMQVAQGTWSGLPLWYTLLSNAANVVEPLVGAQLQAGELAGAARGDHDRAGARVARRHALGHQAARDEP